MRTIEDLISSFREGLNSISSPLSNFSRYSNVYVLARALAYPILSKQAEFEITKASLFVNTATGKDLDDRAFEYGVTRMPGSNSSGSILLSGVITSIPEGTILSTANGKFQFKLTRSILANSTSSTIESLYTGIAYNLEAGTRLYSSLYPNIIINIGSLKQGSRFTGDLVGGKETETDSELRARLKKYISARNIGSLYSLPVVLGNKFPTTKILLYEDVAYPGLFTLYVDSKDLKLINEIDKEVVRIKPAGSKYSISPINYTPVYFSVQITVCDSCNVSIAVASVKSTINRILTSKVFNQPITLREIQIALASIRDITSITILNPTSDIKLINNTLPIANEIKVTIL